jgi:elongation factor P hydroxylase
MKMTNDQELLNNMDYLYSKLEPAAQKIMTVFNARFGASNDPTVLLPGSGDPEYRPGKGTDKPNRIYFAHGFAASALHEVAHWSIAGAARRLLVDYGYWYVPDGRSIEQQKEFFEFEAKPQALEWLFSLASDLPFFISCDNLNGPEGAVYEMRNRVCEQAKLYLSRGLPRRAELFIQDLSCAFDTQQRFDCRIQKIKLDELKPG